MITKIFIPGVPSYTLTKYFIYGANGGQTSDWGRTPSPSWHSLSTAPGLLSSTEWRTDARRDRWAGRRRRIDPGGSGSGGGMTRRRVGGVGGGTGAGP